MIKTVATAVILLVCTPLGLWAAGRLELRAVDRETGQPLAVRLHLKNAQGRPFKPARLKGGIVWGDHIVFADKIVLDLPNGRYQFVMEHGPEYHVMNGHFDIQNFADDSKTVELTRFCNMAEEGWFSGDLDVHRPEKQIELLMQAEDLHIVPLITWTNKKNPWNQRALPNQVVNQFNGSFFYSVMGGEWTTPGNTLRLFRLDRPLELPKDSNPFSTGDKQPLTALGSLPLVPVVEQARREHRAWIDAGALFARDLPIWIAAGLVDSVQLANQHLQREGVVPHEAGGWPRDKALFPGPHGNGRWSQEIYYHLLNCGLRIPPTAGSGSGVSNNPVGYNRVYVHVGENAGEENAGEAAADKITWDTWWDALRSGRVTITNGPLLRTNVDGQLPGHVFKADAGETVELLIALGLSTRDKIRYLEVVKNGRAEISVSLDEFQGAGGKLPPLRFTESGWFVVRAIADTVPTYRYATSGPYYVEIGYQPRISRESAQFFLDWINKRAEEIAAALPNDDSPRAQATKQNLERAQRYWNGLLNKANAE